MKKKIVKIEKFFPKQEKRKKEKNLINHLIILLKLFIYILIRLIILLKILIII